MLKAIEAGVAEWIKAQALRGTSKPVALQGHMGSNPIPGATELIW